MAEYPTRSTAGFTFHVTEDVRAFMRYELDNADVGRSSRSVLGMESQLGRNTIVESRYNLEDALLGQRGYAQVGLRTKLPLSPDWVGDASLERVQTTQGSTGGDFTALATGFEYLPARVKLALRYEVRFGDLEDRHTVTAAGATRLTDGLSLFMRERFFYVSPDNAEGRLDGDGLLGLAYRPVNSDRLNYLFQAPGAQGEGALGAGSPVARSFLAVLEATEQPVPRVHLMGRIGWRRSSDILDGCGVRHKRLARRGAVPVRHHRPGKRRGHVQNDGAARGGIDVDRVWRGGRRAGGHGFVAGVGIQRERFHQLWFCRLGAARGGAVPDHAIQVRRAVSAGVHALPAGQRGAGALN